MTTARAVSIAFALACACPAHASFHFMQIEQVIGGVGGDVSQQAVQLRMRSNGQNQLQFARLRVLDAAGANPVLLVDFSTTVPNADLGDRVLIASADFAAAQAPAPDFVMSAQMPPTYFAGGQLQFESDGGQVIYALCWGNYTGSTTGSIDNDDNGQYGPCEPGPLPAGNLTALRFSGAANAIGTTNAADFALTAGVAVFTNNAGTGAALVAPLLADRGGDCDDTDAQVFPGHAEVVGNFYDDDCDGLADEDVDNILPPDTVDRDGDGNTLEQGDCDDNDTTRAEGNAEAVGDRVDNDCDGIADEDNLDVFSADGIDHDGDGFGMFGRVFASGFEL